MITPDVVDALQASRKDPRLFGRYVVLVRRRGYTQQEIADAIGVTRQYVSLVEQRALRDGADGARMDDLPTPKLKQGRSAYTPPARQFTLDPMEQATLLGLWLMSSRVRRGTAEDSPYRVATERFNEQVEDLLARGLTLVQIAHDIGVDPGVLRARLHRHGITVGGAREIFGDLS